MSTSTLTAEAAGQAQSSRRSWGWRSVLALQVLIATLVSISVFRGLMMKGGEEDARHALRWIATEMQRSQLPQGASLAGWVDQHPILQHRLGDARTQGPDLVYHGYRLGWQPEGQGGGTLWAEPLKPGTTGQTPYRLTLQHQRLR